MVSIARSLRMLYWVAIALLVTGCLPLDAELPVVPPFDGARPDGARSADAELDAGPSTEADRGSPLDVGVDVAPDARPSDAAVVDGHLDAARDAGSDLDPPDLAGPSCADESLRPGPPRALVGARAGVAVGVDPTALAFLGGDLFVLDGLNRRILRVDVDDGRVWPVAGEVPGDPFDRLRTDAEHVALPLLDMTTGRGALFVADGRRVIRLEPDTGAASVVQMQLGDLTPPLALPEGTLTRLAFQEPAGAMPRLIVAGAEPWPATTWAASCVDVDCRVVRAPERFSGSRLDGDRQCNDDPRRGDRVVYDEVRAIAADPDQVAVAARGRSRTPSNGCSDEFEWIVSRVGDEELRYNKVPCDTPGCDTRVDPAPWVDAALWQGDVYAVEAVRNRVVRISPGERPPESVVANPLSSDAPADDGACAALTGFDGLRSIAIDDAGLIAVGSRGRVELLRASDGCGGDLARHRRVGLPDDAPADPLIGRPGTVQRLGEPRAVVVVDDVAHVADRAAGAVHRISLVDGRLLEPVRLGPGSGPTGLAVADGRVWGVASELVAVGAGAGADLPRAFVIDRGADVTVARPAPWGPGPTCRAQDAGLYAPLGLAAGPDGLYAADLYRLRRFSVAGGAPSDFVDVLAAPPPDQTACERFAQCVDGRPCAALEASLAPLDDGQAVSMVARAGAQTWVALDGRPELWRCDADGCAPREAPGQPTALAADDDGLLMAWTDAEGGHRVGRPDGEALAGCPGGACARAAADPGGRLGRVGALAVDPRDDALLMADGDRLRRIARPAARVETVAGGRDPRGLGPFFGGWLPGPGGIAAAGDGRWVVAGRPGRLFVLDPLANTSAALVGDPGGDRPEDDDPCDGTVERPALEPALLGAPTPARLADGRLLLVDADDARLWIVDPVDSTLRCVWRAAGGEPPTSAAVDGDTGALYVALGTDVHRFDVDGARRVRGPAVARLGVDKGSLTLAVSDGVLHIGARSGALFTRGLVDDAPLAIVESVEAAAPGPIVAITAGLGRIWFAARDSVWRVDPDGRLTAVWPRGREAEHTCIAGLAVDGACGRATLAFTDRCDGAVVEVPLGPAGE